MIIGRIDKNGVYRRYGDPGFDGYEDSPVKGIPTIRTEKPLITDSMAVHADQVSEFNRTAARGVTYEEGTGRMIATSKHAARREAKRRGRYYNC